MFEYHDYTWSIYPLIIKGLEPLLIVETEAQERGQELAQMVKWKNLA